MTAPAPHQTISYLARRFAEAGIQLQSRHGQNFLVDLNLQRLIVDEARLEPGDVVLEVGTGTGSLTALVAPRVAAVVTVEIDPRLYQLASEELDALSNVVMLQFDALESKSRLDGRLVAAIETQLAGGQDRRLKLVANLPYSVATPLVANLLASTIVPQSMTITVQKEVADRIAAAPGTHEYGALSVWVQSQCQVEMVRVLPPSVFWPRPKVTSAVIRVELNEARRGQIADLAFFHDFVRSLFFHRRKYLRSVLASALKGRMDKAEIDAVLERAGLQPTVRAEELDVPTIVGLSDHVRAALDGGKTG